MSDAASTSYFVHQSDMTVSSVSAYRSSEHLSSIIIAIMSHNYNYNILNHIITSAPIGAWK